ncbi:hypothetical protein KC723_02435 [Candidatus Kaiserbacteria bacterium]|nr:hypothetical protein [Candidatus Kaiserbacteria bacterium]
MIDASRAKQKGYITLKEAAQISSYSPDYIGQLIRSGKIKGEQVYMNVAWVTTEAEIMAYTNRLKQPKVFEDKPDSINYRKRNVLVTTIAILIMFVLLPALAYLFVLPESTANVHAFDSEHFFEEHAYN